ncbi:MAG TPA: hypothetical protein VHC49_26150, partial [Mycobacteriales bacterium]|nr:hypothetical protein [Mycobacteriales bacterium]
GQDDQAPGTVFLCLYYCGRYQARRLDLEGDDPGAICHATCTAALELLAATLTDRMPPVGTESPLE